MSTDTSDYKAEILMHAQNEVFYNKTQVNNRDTSIAVLRTFISKRKEEHKSFLSKRKKKHHQRYLKILYMKQKLLPYLILKKLSTPLMQYLMTCALSASGLRATRYAREVEGIAEVVALDNDKVSVEACRRNIKFNGLPTLKNLTWYEIIVDLDPYGSPSVFLDSAVQSIADGGMLMCTATDMAVLCGGNGEVCYSKYGSYPLRAKYCNEMALRILLACIESRKLIQAIYCSYLIQKDFNVRIFVRVYISASAMKNTPLKLSYVYQCVGCDSFHLQPIGRTVSKHLVLTTISEELRDVPLFLSLHNLCATLKCTSPSAIMFHSAVINAGYRISGSGTHVNPLGIKSDAPMNVWDIMRCWVKSHPVKAQPPDYAGSIILAKKAELQANFAIAVASLSKAQAKKITRFLPNPERHWGPKLKADRTITSMHVSLLGPHAINGTSDDEESDEPQAKHKKAEDSTLAL
ncbi:hypothetical protein ACET3Z_011211 [Daucus carota]